MEREVIEQELGGRNMDEESWISPLEVLDQLIVHGHDAHEGLRRLERQQEPFIYSDKPLSLVLFQIQFNFIYTVSGPVQALGRAGPLIVYLRYFSLTQNCSHYSQSDNRHVSSAGTSLK